MDEERVAQVGYVVGYVMDVGNFINEVRPAIVIHNWSGQVAVDPETGQTVHYDPGTVQLQVFTDGDGGRYNDGLPNVVWKTSIAYSPDKRVGTWHWLD